MTPASFTPAPFAPNDDAVIRRTAVRAILLTPERETLLLRIQPPEGSPFWITPGGGVEPGETHEAALRRELREELAITVGEIGPVLWRRQHTFNWAGARLHQDETYYLVPTLRFTPQMHDAREALTLAGLRWWRYDELAGATERLTPLSLAQIVASWLAHGAPRTTPAVEMLVD